MTTIIPDLVNDAAVLASAYNLSNVHIVKPSPFHFKMPKTTKPDPSLYLSALNTVVLVDLTFHGQTYTNELGQSRTFPDIVLQTVLLSVSQSKEIVKTKINGRSGTIKEYIALGDYEVSISAILTGANGVYPKDSVQPMIAMLECPGEITVTSWYLNMFSINSIVINSYSLSQDEGGYSRQAISISASSDQTANLRFIGKS